MSVVAVEGDSALFLSATTVVLDALDGGADFIEAESELAELRKRVETLEEDE